MGCRIAHRGAQVSVLYGRAQMLPEAKRVANSVNSRGSCCNVRSHRSARLSARSGCGEQSHCEQSYCGGQASQSMRQAMATFHVQAESILPWRGGRLSEPLLFLHRCTQSRALEVEKSSSVLS